MEAKRKTRIGHVISTKMDKTAVVVVETSRRHPIYNKPVKKALKYKAHDENNKCQLGDMVRIVETRPLSKAKRWRVAEVITKREVAEIQPKEISSDFEKQES